MSLETTAFTTGPATLPDVGNLSYNGCTFSPLYETNVSGKCVKDRANRTTKYMEYLITADGYVTLPESDSSIAPTMNNLRRLLSAHGGSLYYSGRGCDIVVNNGPRVVGSVNDLSWGPSPELLEFQPLGGGRSAKIKWQVKVCIPEIPKGRGLPGLATPRFRIGGLALRDIPILEFNYETKVVYNEDYFSSLSINGTLEVPLTRPNQTTRTVPYTADSLRDMVEARIMSGVDLARYRVTRREFSLSRDKRILEWSFSLEEKSYMDIPPDCTIARGTFSCRPSKSGMALINWICTLRATYTVRKDRPRRTAWLMFLLLLRARMDRARLYSNRTGTGSAPRTEATALRETGRAGGYAAAAAAAPFLAVPIGLAYANDLITSRRRREEANTAATTEFRREQSRAWLIDFSVEEGLYLDSKTVSFSASWKMVTTFSHVLLASGLWVKLPERYGDGNNVWATSIRPVSGSVSWDWNEVDPSLDVIVDFGS